jgi:succinate-semialdehyde dehydrogenase/glutarate-semialdehyde dehydrogenase
MPSADVEEAAKTAVKARTINNGQSCIAAKRFIVAEGVYDQFERRFVEGMERLRVGDPLEETTDIGPLATSDVLEDLDEQVRKSVEAGARVLTGGRRMERPGNYYAPTVITDIPVDSPAYREELFGPVALLFRVRDTDAAVRLANDSIFGLASSVWTEDEAERRRFIEEIDGRVRPAFAFRRRQAFGLRARAERLRHTRVRQHQDRLDKGSSRILSHRDGVKNRRDSIVQDSIVKEPF